MKKQPAIETAMSRSVNVLSVSPVEDDRVALEQILSRPQWAAYSDVKWTLRSVATVEKALTALHAHSTSVVLCEHDLPGATWIDLLEKSAGYSACPHLIVTSRLADDRLWGEALNLGAYDVLAKPFEPDEVIRIVSLAWLHWREQNLATPGRTMRCVA